MWWILGGIFIFVVLAAVLYVLVWVSLVPVAFLQPLVWRVKHKQKWSIWKRDRRLVYERLVAKRNEIETDVRALIAGGCREHDLEFPHFRRYEDDHREPPDGLDDFVGWRVNSHSHDGVIHFWISIQDRFAISDPDNGRRHPLEGSQEFGFHVGCATTGPKNLSLESESIGLAACRRVVTLRQAGL